MIIPFTRLRGKPVFTASGHCLGRVSDIVFAPEGQLMVARTLLVVPNRFLLLAEVFRSGTAATAVPATRIASIEAGRITLQASDD